MKLIITTFLATLALQSVSAQEFSVGIRTGLGKTMDVSRISAGTIDNTWDKELFVRYETKRRLAFEVGGTQYNTSHSMEPMIWECNWGLPITYEDAGMNAKSSIIDFHLSAQYDISCGYIKENCPFMKNFRSFIGVNIGARYESAEVTRYQKQISDGHITKEVSEQAGINTAQMGLSHTITYRLKKIVFSSVAAYTVYPWSMSTMYIDGNAYPNSKLSLRIGVGYTL